MQILYLASFPYVLLDEVFNNFILFTMSFLPYDKDAKIFPNFFINVDRGFDIPHGGSPKEK